MIDTEQNKQNKVLLIFVKVKKAQLFVISLPDTAFKEDYMVHTWLFPYFMWPVLESSNLCLLHYLPSV